jgi:hypothetical protein
MIASGSCTQNSRHEPTDGVGIIYKSYDSDRPEWCFSYFLKECKHCGLLYRANQLTFEPEP